SSLKNCGDAMRAKTRKSFRRRLRFEALEERRLLAAGFAEFVDPDATIEDGFGTAVVPLSTGNVVISAPYDDAGGTDAGAVYLFNGASGILISTLRGTHPGDNVGSSGVWALSNGNYLVLSASWDNETAALNAGAVTFGNRSR